MTMTPFLFDMPRTTWIPIRDGDWEARAFYDKHYSRYHYVDGRRPKLFIGPGEKMALRTPCGRALWAWRKYISRDGQVGINCSIFRNEGAGRSSDLILAAEEMAWTRWPKQRCFTYINARAIRSTNPGYCYIKAGWRRCGITRRRGYLIFEKYWEIPTPARSFDEPAARIPDQTNNSIG